MEPSGGGKSNPPFLEHLNAKENPQQSTCEDILLSCPSLGDNLSGGDATSVSPSLILFMEIYCTFLQRLETLRPKSYTGDLAHPDDYPVLHQYWN